MTSKYDVNIRDYGRETSTAGFRGTTLNAGNFVAQLALQATLLSTLQDIVLGEVAKTKVVAVETIVSGATPASELAQRENKWLVRYTDNTTGVLYSLEIPTADLAGHLLGNTDQADLTETDMAAFVAAFEAYVVSPVANAVTVVEILHVGRNI